MSNQKGIFLSLTIQLIFCCTLCAGSISPAALANLLRSADTPKSVEETKAIALNNLDTLAMVLKIPNGDGLARLNAISILHEASFESKISHKQFFVIVAEQIANLGKFSRRENTDFEGIILSNSIIFHGYAPKGKACLPLEVNFSNLGNLIAAFETSGLLLPFKDFAAFLSKGETLLENGNEHEAKSLLDKFYLEIENTKIDTKGKAILLGYLRNLLIQIQNKPRSEGK
ncbi:hypothetical protein AUK22_02275 [bacterium CG2_30_54_10]|nr:MAG: hypothetical protein AUK22_02275 [bacterium CG2_30_54_10]